MRSPASIAIAVVAVSFLALGAWYFADGRWSGLHWDEYLRSHQCTAETLSQGQNIRRNRLYLQGDGDTAGYRHHLSLWRCNDGQLVAVYGGLEAEKGGAAVPLALIQRYAGKYHHGLYGGDDAHRFLGVEDLLRLRSIDDWDALIQARGH
ncbi:MAG: hypothetical protein KGN39_01100 [Betaproteobacteria bacterium]|nr:hypothetical protein [Betaproteobacteria bacterium]